MVERKYITDFENWCRREHIKLTPNSEVFFINKRKTLVPMYKVGASLFIHLVDSDDVHDHPMYQSFANSFYTILVIPKNVIGDLIKSITRKDIAEYFNIRL